MLLYKPDCMVVTFKLHSQLPDHGLVLLPALPCGWDNKPQGAASLVHARLIQARSPLVAAAPSS